MIGVYEHTLIIMLIIGLGKVEWQVTWLVMQKILFSKTLTQGKVNAANTTSLPIVCKGKINVEVVSNHEGGRWNAA